MNDDTSITQTRVLIVGAGPAGLGVSLALKQAGVTEQLIVDAREVGASFRAWPSSMALLTPSFFSNAFGLTDLNSIDPDTSPADFLHTQHPMKLDENTVVIYSERRKRVESHHTATHLMHWALHQAIGPDVSQQGSLVDCDRLRFDFNSEALSKDQLLAVETIVNEKIKDNDLVSWTEVKHADIKDRSDIMQFFGDKYGEMVRVVQIGGNDNDLDGYSMELCGGTHLRNTGEVGSFKIKTEGAISAGVRRIEAVCGEAAQEYVEERIAELTKESKEISSSRPDVW